MTDTTELIERLRVALKGYDEAVEWHSYRPHDVNRERDQHAAAAVLADELRSSIPALSTSYRQGLEDAAKVAR